MRRGFRAVAVGAAVVAAAGALAAVAVAFTPHGLPGGARDLVIRDARLLDPAAAATAAGPTAPVGVYVHDGRIARIGGEMPADVPVLDAGGRVAMPGMIDAHTHLLRAGSCGADEGVGIANVRQVALNLDSTLRHGTTTALDLGGPAALVLALRDALAAEGSLAPRVLAAGPVLTAPGGYPLDWADGEVVRDLEVVMEIGSPEAARETVRALAARGVDAIKLASMERSYNEVPLPALDGATLAAAVDEAHRSGLRAFVHAHSVAGYRAALAARADVIAHSSFEPLPDDVVAGVVAAGVVIVPTLWVFASFEAARADPAVVSAAEAELLPPFAEALRDFHARASARDEALPDDFLPGIRWARVREGNGVARANLARLHAAGATIALGTDTSFCYAVHDSAWRELGELVRAGLSPLEALRAGTLGSARALGRDDLGLGRIVEGGPADLVVVDGDPLADVRALALPWAVIRDGRVVREPVAPPGIVRSMRWLGSLVWWSMR